MNTSGEAAEQIVRISLEGTEVALKLTGAAAKNIAAMIYIRFAGGIPVFIYRNNFKQTVGGDYRAVSGRQVPGGIQTESDGGNFAVCAESELLILFLKIREK